MIKAFQPSISKLSYHRRGRGDELNWRAVTSDRFVPWEEDTKIASIALDGCRYIIMASARKDSPQSSGNMVNVTFKLKYVKNLDQIGFIP